MPLELNSKQRFLVGGMAAMLPFIATALLIDKEALSGANFDLVKLAGISVRAVVLFVIGGYITHLYDDENNRVKLFNIGLGAPAMLVAVTNGITAQPHARNAAPVAVLSAPATQARANEPAGFLQFIPQAHAQPAKGEAKKAGETAGADGPRPAVKEISSPEESFLDRFARGLFANYQTKSWYVTVGTFPTVQDAQKAAREIEERKKNPLREEAKFQKVPDFAPEIFAHPGKGEGYTVAVGQQMRWSDAESLRVDLQDLGIAKNAVLRNAIPSSAK